MALIALATLVLRYHYAVDLLAAGALAWVASEAARRAMRRRAAVRRDAAAEGAA